MEVVQQLAELRVVDGAVLLLAEVALDERPVQLEWYFRMQIGLLDDVGEVGCEGGTVAV